MGLYEDAVYLTLTTIPLLLNIMEKSDRKKDVDLLVRDRPERAARGDLVIYSMMTPFIHEMAEEIRGMKLSGAQVVIGGPHPDFDNHELLLRMGATSVTACAAENGLIPIVDAFLSGELPKHPFWSGSAVSAAEISEYLPLTEDLPTIPPLELMRGCGYACPFCATSGHRKCFRDWSSIERYLQELRERKARRVNFIVPSALEFMSGGLDVEGSLLRLFDACRNSGSELIEYGIFPSEIRPETVTESKIGLLKQVVANRSLTMGLQTGDTARATQIRRQGARQAMEQAIDTIHSQGFAVNLDLIVGFPGEDWNEFEESVESALRLVGRGRIRLQVHRFFPLGRSPWQWRKPSDLDVEKTEKLEKLEKGGVISSGWRLNEEQWRTYWSWLNRSHPDWASRYR